MSHVLRSIGLRGHRPAFQSIQDAGILETHGSPISTRLGPPRLARTMERLLRARAEFPIMLSADHGPRYYSNVRHEMVPFLPAQYSRVLEVGCGEGAFVQLLSQPCETWGIELEPDRGARAATVMHKVLVGPYDAVQHELPLRYFDLVICNDVIEHLPDPEAFLTSIRARMTPGGHIVASIPNMRHWEVLAQLLVRKDWHYVQDGIMDRTHMKFFTEKSIERLFRETGFAVLQQEGINGVFHPLRRVIVRAIGYATFGYYRDIEYRQFAVRAQLP